MVTRTVSGRKAGSAIVRSSTAAVRAGVAAEDAAAARFVAALRPGAREVAAVIRRECADDPLVLQQEAVLVRVLAVHATALLDAMPAWQEGVWDGLRASASSVLTEMRWCEKHLGGGYVGVTDAVRSGVALAALDVLAGTVDRYADVPVRATTALGDGLRRQAALAAEAGEDVATLVSRVVSEEPLTLHGNRGIGVWFRAGYSLSGSLTLATVEASALLRRTAMGLWNEEAEAR